MAARKTVLACNQVYHLVNRGVDQKTIFPHTRDYQRGLLAVDFYRYKHPPLRLSHYLRLNKENKESFLNRLRRKEVLVEIFAFCLMPNHFHLLLRQLRQKGISIFMGNLQNSYARYFNTKYKRVSPLFQSVFKAVRIETDEQLLHVSRYIHLNPVSSYLIKIKDLENYPWSSFPTYMGKQPSEFTNTKFILDFFKSKEKYKEFVLNQAGYQRELEKIKHIVLEG